MEPITTVLNKLPVRTWNKLHMNEVVLNDIALAGAGPAPSGTELADEDYQGLNWAFVTGCGRDIDQLLDKAAVRARFVNVAAGETATARVTYTFADGTTTGQRLYIGALAGAQVTVLVDITSDKPEATGLGVLQTRIYAAKGATVRVIHVVRPGSGFTLVNDLGGFCETGARIELVQPVLRGGKVYQGAEIRLDGREATAQIDAGFGLDADRVLDMNYVVRHAGAHTESLINAHGSLRNSSLSVFRGTIDFLHGSDQAVGNEREDVLIIDETAINRTVPLILCAEENVVGNHGASIGRPDEDMVFYLMSRGVSEEDAIKMIADAKLRAVIDLIPDDDFRKEVAAFAFGRDEAEVIEEGGAQNE